MICRSKKPRYPIVAWNTQEVPRQKARRIMKKMKKFARSCPFDLKKLKFVYEFQPIEYKECDD
jgi:hypothetical protein